jgi:hypothetical protein
MSETKRYRAIQLGTSHPDKKLVICAAPATEIEIWAGVPQKKRFGQDESGVETTGFQRELNDRRMQDLVEFYKDDKNIIQNPLLCATRDLPFASVTFESDTGADGNAHTGWLAVSYPEFDSMSLMDILGKLKESIERRVPELSTRIINEQLIADIKLQLTGGSSSASDRGSSGDEYEDDENEEAVGADDPSNSEASSALFEESHILDLWDELAARHHVLVDLGDSFSGDDICGFSRDGIISYLKPIVLVDGQHRLFGALASLKSRMESDDQILAETESRIGAGESSANVEADIRLREVRQLPISLLISNDPAEQVFQFVVVNQKATPIGKALLGTIVSTTLSSSEAASIASRLKDAGIQLEESQAITYMARLPSSPFHNLIERGLTGNNAGVLKWNVIASLIDIFRDLRGGKLYNSPKNDWPAVWRRDWLSECAITNNYEAEGFETEFKYWRNLDGPWRDVFIAFWTRVRDKLADKTNSERPNFWGNPRDSNLFNKISLMILAADFFRFMKTQSCTISSADEIGELVDQWLKEVNVQYFDRDWSLSGVKKDSTGIRKQWAQQWSDHRDAGGQLPDKRKFRIPLS